MGRVPAVIELTEEEERDLRLVWRTPSAPLERATRARIVLRAAEGASNTQIAREVGVSLPTVGLWRRNFSERRMDGLETAPRSGRPREITDDEVQRVFANVGRAAGRHDALECAQAGDRDGDLVLDGAPDLARAQAQGPQVRSFKFYATLSWSKK